MELDCCEHCRLFPCFPLLCASSPKRANVCPELRWQLSHAKVLGEGSGWSVIRGICLFPTTQTLCLRLEQGHYSQPAMHECTAGSADIACPISILHIPSLNSPFHLECSDCIFFFNIPRLLREMEAIVSDLTGSQAPRDGCICHQTKKKTYQNT